jgi:hypothetical protein
VDLENRGNDVEQYDWSIVGTDDPRIQNENGYDDCDVYKGDLGENKWWLQGTEGESMISTLSIKIKKWILTKERLNIAVIS